MFNLSFSSTLPLIVSVFFLLLGILVYIRSKRRELSRILFFWCLASSIWLLAYSLAYGNISRENSFLYFKIGYSGVVFVGIIGFQYTIRFLKIKRLDPLLSLNYFAGVIFLFLIWRTGYFISGVYKYFWGYYPKAGLIHPLFLIFFIGLTTIAVVLVIINLLFRSNKLTLIERSQVKYMTLAFFVYNFACIDFLPNYGIEIYPLGCLPAFIFASLVAYTIIKYRFMDVSVAITRTGVFVAVYSLVLGVPFIIAYAFRPYLIAFFGDKWWLVPMGLLTVMATAGPFIYIYINSRAEDRLLREQRRYQQTLRQASSGMIRVRELRRLLHLIVHVVTKTVKIEFASIFLLDSENNHYTMVANRGSLKLSKQYASDIESPLVKHLHLLREPLVYEEIQLQSQDNPHDSRLVNLERQLGEMGAAVVIPSFVGNKLLGFIVLGKKLSGKIYSQDDLNVFSVLANQAALAIENALFYEEVKETQEQLFQAEKMATIGTMADGLSHQINNRFQALSLISGDSLDILKTTDVSGCSQEVKDSFEQLKYAFERIQSNVVQGGEVVKGLLRYSRPGQTGFEPTDFNKVIEGAMEMVQYKVRIREIDIEKNIPVDLPKIKCNLTQLQEVFFNLIDNAYDAIKERKATLKEPDFKGKIELSVIQQDATIRVLFKDNGIGVKDKDKDKLFTPFFTTKATAQKGTGLGLYVIQKIIAFHNGAITIDSTYKVGTTFEITLALSK